MDIKRVLYLNNKISLRDYDVPLLIDMGYEVYCPKVEKMTISDWRINVTHEYDGSLSIPKEIIDKLNNINFYEPIDFEVKEIINQYFQAVIFCDISNQLETICCFFSGAIVLRMLGLKSGESYTRFITKTFGVSIWTRLEKIHHRFYAAPFCSSMMEHENRFLRNRTFILPVCLDVPPSAPLWKGTNPAIFVPCPNISSDNKNNEKYKEVKNILEGMSYVIGGHQLVPVKNDYTVSSRYLKSDHDRCLADYKIMYSPSSESKYYLEEYPVEAIRRGMPVLYMPGTFLDLFEMMPPNLASTTAKKLKKSLYQAISLNDKYLNRIAVWQKNKAMNYSYEVCKTSWQSLFSAINESKIENSNNFNKIYKIAIVIPNFYTGGVLDYSLRFAKCIHKGLISEGKEFQITIAHLDHDVYKDKDYFVEARKIGIQIRAFKWVNKDAQYIKTYTVLNDLSKFDIEIDECCIMYDGIQGFEDQDLIIFTADRIPSKFLSKVPYIIVAHDYIQRYCPELMPDIYEKSIIDNTRYANNVFVTTQATYDDAVQYAGIKKDKLTLAPLLFDAVDVVQTKLEHDNIISEHFIWPTNPSIHKNHMTALRALSDYYHNGGQLKCYMTGASTELFDISKPYKLSGIKGLDDYLSKIRGYIDKDSNLKNHDKLMPCGNMDKQKYYQLLSKASFIFHPGYADKGNGSILDAAFLGVPSLSSRYPAMEFINNRLSLNCVFFDPHDHNDIAEQIFFMEQKCHEIKQTLPSRTHLISLSADSIYYDVYKCIKPFLEF